MAYSETSPQKLHRLLGTPDAPDLIDVSIEADAAAEQLDAGVAFYDALFRPALDGFAEGHDWPADRRA